MPSAALIIEWTEDGRQPTGEEFVNVAEAEHYLSANGLDRGRFYVHLVQDYERRPCCGTPRAFLCRPNCVLA